MRREKKKRNKIIIGLVSILLLMTVGYAAFQINLNIKGTSKISSSWDIRITNVTSGTSVGNGENAKTPTWTNLTASMEANLYEKGDAMEYEVTVENKGTFDAKLENILTNIKSNNEAIKISFSGYTKGEKLYKNSSKVVNVKIEYNKDYEGTAPNTSSEVEITLDYGQAEGGTITPTNDYLVTYDCKTNGGISSNSQSEYISEGSNIDLSYTATKSGWTFAGWNTNKDATTGLTTLEMKNADVTLYAIYKKTINVTYTKSTGITSIGKTNDSCIMYNLNTSCQITLPSIIASTGYGVDGWYNSSNTKVGTEGTKVNVSTDKTSYTAKGKANSYTLSYNYNGATGGNSTTSKAVTYNGTYGTLPNPTRSYVVTYNYNNATSGNTTANATSNYTFNGWYKESTFTNPVTSSTIYNIASNSTIYAKWTGTSIVLPSPTRTGYAFAGWYSDSSLTNKVGDAGVSYTPTSTQTLYAKWTVNGYTVTYDYKTNGGSSATKTSATVNYGSAVDLTPTATKSGWTFAGWNTNKDATIGLSSLTMSTSNVTLYAIYRKEAITLTAKFNANGATLSATSNLTCTLPAVYNNASQATSCNVTAPTITRSGYNIIGYNTAATSTTNNGSYNTTSKALTLTSSNNNSTWYAITSKAVTITFNRNGASTQTNSSGTSVADATVTRACTMYNTNTSCNVTSPTIVGASGFNVVGYNTAVSSTASAWNQATSKAVSANATYYAVTKSTAAYTANFNANGATSIGSSSLACNRYNGSYSCNITAPSITRTGFTITGWNTTSTATTSTLSVGATLALTNNSAYYAITNKAVVINYSKDSTVSAIGATSGTCSIWNSATTCSVTLPTITPITGYTTLGWYNGTTKVGNASAALNVSANATYTAKASDVTKPTISLNPNTQASYVSGGKAVTVNLADAGSGLKASQPIYYAWSTSNTTAPTTWSSVTSTNATGAKSATVTVPASSNSSLTGTYYLWIKASTLADVSGNTSNQVISGAFKFDNTNPTVSISTSKTTKSITVVATASALSGISKYEFSKDNGATWISNGTNKTYTFTGLTHKTAYNIKARVTSGVSRQGMASTVVTTTNTVPTPTYSSVNNGEVTITYPAGCGSTYTCSYIKDGGTPVTVTGNTTVYFGANGTLVAKVSDGTNTVSASTYSVVRNDLYVSSTGNDTTGYGTINKPYATIPKAYNSANTTATIKVMNNLTVTSTIDFNANKNITLTSYGSTINSLVRATSNTKGNIIYHNLGTVILSNIIIDGNNVGADSAMVYIASKLTLESGATIKNAKNISGIVGGVAIDKAGTFTINGGSVINNSAPSVGGLDNTGVTTMNSGTVSGNTGKDVGGVNSNGTFTINGGTITNNTGIEKIANAGGVWINSGQFIIKGGTINDNKVSVVSGGASIIFNIIEFQKHNITTTDYTMSPTFVHNASGYKLVSALSNSKAISIQNDSNCSVATGDCNVQLWDFTGDISQRWGIGTESVVSGKTYYKFYNQGGSDKCLDVNSNGTADSTNIAQYRCNSTDGQRFYLVSSGDGYYYIKHKTSNKCVDISGANTTNGTNIQIYTCNNSNAQKWKFVQI